MPEKIGGNLYGGEENSFNDVERLKILRKAFGLKLLEDWNQIKKMYQVADTPGAKNISQSNGCISHITYNI